MTKQERKKWEARAIAVGLPKDASEADIVAAEEAKNKPVKKAVVYNEVEETTSKIFNLSENKPSEKKAENKPIETNPVKAWGKN